MHDIRARTEKVDKTGLLKNLQRDIRRIELETYSLMYRIHVAVREVQITLDAYHSGSLTCQEALNELNDDYESSLLSANKIINEHNSITQRFIDINNDKMEESYQELMEIELTFTNLIENIDDLFNSARKIVITSSGRSNNFSRHANNLDTFTERFLAEKN